MFLQLNVRYNERWTNFWPGLSPKYLPKNPSILAFSLSYCSLESYISWWLFARSFLCFFLLFCFLCVSGFFFIFIAMKVQHSFNILNIFLFCQLEVQATKVVLHQVAVTVLQQTYFNLVSSSSGRFPSFYHEEIGMGVGNKKGKGITRFFSSI